MIATFFFIIAVAIVAAIKSNIISGILFSLGVFATLLLLPLIAIVIIGFLIYPFTAVRSKRQEKKMGIAASWERSAKEGKVLGNIIQIMTFASILFVSYRMDHSYLWAALVGIMLKLASDYAYGDTFFEYRKKPAN